MTASLSERGVFLERGEQKKSLGRVIIVDHKGQSRDTVTAIVMPHAVTMEQYDTVETALEAIVGEQEISVVISAYSVPDTMRRTGVDVIRAVKNIYPKARGILLSAIPDLIAKTKEVSSLEVALVAREDPTKINGKTEEVRAQQVFDSRHEFERKIREALFGKEVIV